VNVKRSMMIGGKKVIMNHSEKAYFRAARMARKKGPETFKATVVNHLGRVLGEYEGKNVQALMALVDAAHPFSPTSSVRVTIRGQFTSIGYYHPGHGGRMVASREAGGGRGRGGWVVE
jgi:hypothetical protein